MVGHWFVRRINLAMAIYSVVMSVGFMIAFPVVGAAIQRWGWRQAWLGIGLALAIVLAPVAAALVRRSPEASGLAPDGVADRVADPVPLEGYRWRDAVASPAFWVFAAGTALYGLVASGIGLFNESVLAERGFGADVYYQTLAVTALTALTGNFAGGWLAGRIRLGVLLAMSLAILTAGLIVLPHLAQLWQVMAWAAMMGAGGGLVMVLFFGVWPRVFGRRELGRIQGTAQAVTVLASALGPLLLAWCVDWTGSYTAMFRLLAGIIAATAACALVVPVPPPLTPRLAVNPLDSAETAH
jgi:MFS family permease